jgi:hypothetical protein
MDPQTTGNCPSETRVRRIFQKTVQRRGQSFFDNAQTFEIAVNEALAPYQVKFLPCQSRSKMVRENPFPFHGWTSALACFESPLSVVLMDPLRWCDRSVRFPWEAGSVRVTVSTFETDTTFGTS